MTYPKRDWRAYPPTYRAREMKILAGWIAAGESGSVLGLPGAGKSNLLGFLCHQPEALAPYLADDQRPPAIIHVDLNNLPASDLSTFFRVILRALFESRVQLEAAHADLPPLVERLYRKVEDKTDPFLAQSALREVLLALAEEQGRLVLVLDPFDFFCRDASNQVLDNLRGLRDSFKPTLSYLFGLRRELTYIRDPDELGELFEIVDTHRLWLGSMKGDDSRWVINQVAGTASQPFTPKQVEQLVNLTGGYPALLRAAAVWLADQPEAPPLENWPAQLLTEPSLQNRLRELWQALTGEEQLALAECVAGGNRVRESLHQPGLQLLLEKRVCHPASEGGVGLFSPLFEEYIRERGTRSVTGKIWQREADGALLQGATNLEQLTAQDRKLLLLFLTNSYRILSKDDIALMLWSDTEISDFDRGVNDVRLQKAVSQLRGVLEKGETGPHYIQTLRGVGYRFFPEGMPHR